MHLMKVAYLFMSQSVHSMLTGLHKLEASGASAEVGDLVHAIARQGSALGWSKQPTTALRMILWACAKLQVLMLSFSCAKCVQGMLLFCIAVLRNARCSGARRVDMP